ncbi:hypothetical protein EIP91_003643 [Steccherinum ochraceum]|uniref:F-box domain-containing protein n=1 Tax=Steccherinum ochraceum TaxID=92696 RepID=A0A4R0RDJ7_9APHY|nr:hypothetical protein EIP91_003643 [Steccherinum ochraceum]
MSKTNFLSLGDEILKAIGVCSSIPDVLSLSQACKRLSEILAVERFWEKYLMSTMGIYSVYRLPRGSSCKDLAVHLYKLYARLQPGQKRKPAVCHYDISQGRSVTWTKIVCHRWIAVASSDDQSSELSLYGLDEGPHSVAKPLTQVSLVAPVIRGVALERGGDVIVAVELCSSFFPSIEVFSLGLCDGKLVFTRLGSRSNASHLRTAGGDWVGMSVCDNHNIPTLWNWKTGDVTRLHKKPERQGGCMSMAIKDDIVAVAYRRKMHIYRINVNEAVLICTQRYRSSYQFSSMVALPKLRSSGDKQDTPMFVLALGARGGIRVYHVPCDPGLDFEPVWTFATPRGSQLSPHKPQLSDNGTMITWLSIPGSVVSRGVHYFLSRLPVPSGITQLPVRGPKDANLTSRFYDLAAHKDIPALGLAVFGNAFGELAVYDFSTTAPDVLSKLFPRPCVPLHNRSIPQTNREVECYEPGYPFPLMSTVHDDETLFLKQAKKANEISSRTTPLSVWQSSWRYRNFRYLVTLLEVRTLYGDVVPFMHKECLDVFRVGDLFVLFDHDDAYCRVLDSTDADQICSQIEANIVPPGRTVYGGDLYIAHDSGLQMHLAERRRIPPVNRASQLRDRGGHVHASWDNVLQDFQGLDTNLGSGFRPYRASEDESDGDSELSSEDIEWE